MKIKEIIIFVLFLAMSLCAQKRVGDAGVTFDSEKFDSNYPEMEKWQQAGVEGGIPYLDNKSYYLVIDPTDSDGINDALAQINSKGGGTLWLTEGEYIIDKTVTVKNNTRIIGDSRDEVILKITMRGTNGSAIHFSSAKNSGIESLTITGGDDTPPRFEMNDTMPNFIITSVYFGGSSKNCWIDKCDLVNSGSNAISIWHSYHITVRDCYIDGSYNKGGGGHGYVQFSGESCLMYNTVVKNMRHICIQREYCKYNVFYQNNVEQDFNFHNADMGYNLIEQNTVILPAGLGDGWHAMMTPWSVQHNAPGPENIIYRNHCVEHNNGGETTFSDPNKIYIPNGHYQDFIISEDTPVGKTFYPVNNVVPETRVPQNNSTAPQQFKLYGNYPNPFNPTTTISYTLNESANISIQIFDISGRLVEKQNSEFRKAGEYKIQFDGTNYSSGVYFYQIQTEKQSAIKAMLLLK